MPLAVLLGTRKGAWILRPDARRESWTASAPHHFGCTVHHLVLDPRDRKTLLATVRTGHLGPTVYRSTDQGETWAEASQPPAFPKPEGGEEGTDKKKAVHHTFWITPGHASRPGHWYGGTSPIGLFETEDSGATWSPVSGFNDHPEFGKWATGELTPDGAKTHSIQVDPRDAAHVYLSLSGGGTFESLDSGGSWAPLNKGVAIDFLPPGEYEYGHDPHCMVYHPLDPDRLYQQNHCGLYRLHRPETTWTRIGDNMPKEIGDIGFVVVVHPREVETVWVWPMDGTDVWPRTSPGGRPAAYRTQDAGETWERQDAGLPDSGWCSVKRQCMSTDAEDPLGLYVGTSSGEVFASRDEGQTWRSIGRHFPHIYSVTVANFA
jgi:hypothetical protein